MQSPCLLASILRDHRVAAELEVEPDHHGRIGVRHRVRQHTVGRRIAMERAVVEIAILELSDQIVGERISDATAGGQAAPCGLERVHADAGIGVGVRQLAISPTAREEQQQAVDRDAAAPPERGTPAQLCRVIPAEREIVVALDVSAKAVCFDTDDDVAALPVGADLAAAEATRRIRSSP